MFQITQFRCWWLLWLTAVIGLSGTAQPVVDAAPIKERDPLLVATKWKGKLTQKGTFAGGVAGPPAFETVLNVTERNGFVFRAELTEEAPGIKVTYLVKGDICPAADKTYTVTFKSIGAKDVAGTLPILGIPYTGTVTGRTIRGTWKMPKNDEGTDVEGDFSVERAE